jgi:hypothetical protein
MARKTSGTKKKKKKKELTEKEEEDLKRKIEKLRGIKPKTKLTPQAREIQGLLVEMAKEMRTKLGKKVSATLSSLEANEIKHNARTALKNQQVFNKLYNRISEKTEITQVEFRKHLEDVVGYRDKPLKESEVILARLAKTPKITKILEQDAAIDRGIEKTQSFARKMLGNKKEFDKLQKKTKIPAKELRKRLKKMLKHEDLIESG